SSRRVSDAPGGSRRRRGDSGSGASRRRDALAEDRRARSSLSGPGVRPRGPGDPGASAIGGRQRAHGRVRASLGRHPRSDAADRGPRACRGPGGRSRARARRGGRATSQDRLAHPMPGRFGGQVAIVTAGGSRISAATARRLAGEGAAVVVADLSGTRAGAVASGITKDGGRAAAIKMDASEPAAVQRTIQLALDTFGRLDVMMNNAGLARPAALDEIAIESWKRVVARTLTR